MYWFQRLFRKNKVERQLDSELSFHLEQVTEAYIQQGLAPDEAARQARIEFGGVEGVKEECRESRRVHLVETFLQDVRYGLRSLDQKSRILAGRYSDPCAGHRRQHGDFFRGERSPA